MELAKWDRMRGIFNMRIQIDRMFDGVLLPVNRSQNDDPIWESNPVADVYDTDAAIVVKAEMPGVEKKDITVAVENGVLTVTGERSAEEELKEDSLHRRELSCGKFQRSFALPGEVDADRIRAEYKHGVLTIDIPKPEGHKPRQISVH